jgi:hypothetical protein
MRLIISALLLTISAAAAQEQRDTPADKNKRCIDASEWLTEVGHPIAPADKAEVADVSLARVAKYVPLTLWSRISLGSSYFTDPKAASEINIVYAYSPDAFKSGDYAKILSGLKDGTLQVGVINGFHKSGEKIAMTGIDSASFLAGYEINPFTATDSNKGQSLQTFIEALKSTKSAVLLANNQKLFGSDASGIFYDTAKLKAIECK